MTVALVAILQFAALGHAEIAMTVRINNGQNVATYGDPIIAEITLQNDGTSPTERPLLHWGLVGSSPKISWSIGQDKVWEFASNVHGNLFLREKPMLGPGEVYRDTFDISVAVMKDGAKNRADPYRIKTAAQLRREAQDRDFWGFPAPGVYTIEASCMYPSGEIVRATSVTISVVDAGEAYKQLVDKYRTKAVAMAALGSNSGDCLYEEGVEDLLRQLVQDERMSRWHPAGLHYLATALSVKAERRKNEGAQRAEMEGLRAEALTYLMELIQNYPDYPAIERALLAAGRMARELSDEQQLSRVVAEARKRVDDKTHSPLADWLRSMPRE